MAGAVSLTRLNSTALLSSAHALQNHAFSVQKQLPACISSGWTHFLKGSQHGQTALRLTLGDPPSSSFVASNANVTRQEGKDLAGCVASASRDGRPLNSGDDENDFRWSPRDGYGLYPWDPEWEDIDLDGLQWIQEETITLFTSEGVMKLGGSRIVTPRSSLLEKKYGHLRALNRLRRYREEDYMDPKQGLCLGAIFDIAATNGLDMGRRFCVFGFCRSIEMLSDVVQDTVLEQGGEVVMAEKGSTTGLHEKLNMTVAMPALWGVPPAFDVLNSAIRTGGGIVEKTYRKWAFL